MNDIKTNQYWIKIQYGNRTIDVREIWADTHKMAILKAVSIAGCMLEYKEESRIETRLRQINRLHDTLGRDCDNLAEFLFDDYGDTVNQLGMERVRKLETKLERQRHVVGLLRNRIDVLERKLAV